MQYFSQDCVQARESDFQAPGKCFAEPVGAISQTVSSPTNKAFAPDIKYLMSSLHASESTLESRDSFEREIERIVIILCH